MIRSGIRNFWCSNTQGTIFDPRVETDYIYIYICCLTRREDGQNSEHVQQLDRIRSLKVSLVWNGGFEREVKQ